MDKSLVSLESQDEYDGQNAGHTGSRGSDEDSKVPGLLSLRTEFKAVAAASTELTTKQINASFFLHVVLVYSTGYFVWPAYNLQTSEFL